MAKLHTALKEKPDFIELRADGIPDFTIHRIPKTGKTKLIFACRSKNNIYRLQSAIDSGRFDYVDVEFENIKHLNTELLRNGPKVSLRGAERRSNPFFSCIKPRLPRSLRSLAMTEKEFRRSLVNRKKTKIIASYHNFKLTPPLAFLKRLHKQMAKTKPDVIKIVTHANDISDNFKIFRLLESVNNHMPIIAFCMGEAGLISRVLYRKFGGWMSYASLNNAEGTADGQLSFQDMKWNYRADKINAKTRVYGVIGNPVKYSLSPVLFNGLFKPPALRAGTPYRSPESRKAGRGSRAGRYKMNAVYLPFLIHNIKVLPELTQALDIQGLSVTMPYKEKILKVIPTPRKAERGIGTSPKLCSGLPLVALRSGAVNTIYRDKKGRLIGANTDGKGALLALGSVKGKKVLVLGAGGAGRAIAYELIQNGAKVIIANRHYAKAIKAARDLGCAAIQWHKIKEAIKQTDILINATPIGMLPNPNATPIPADWLHKDMVVLDTVYQIAHTRLLREAKSKGCKVVSGLDMFINQAGLQFALFSTSLCGND